MAGMGMLMVYLYIKDVSLTAIISDAHLLILGDICPHIAQRHSRK